MTGALIKSGSNIALRGIGALSVLPAMSLQQQEQQRLQSEISALRSELIALAEKMEVAQACAASAYETGHADGRQEGLEQASQDDCARIGLLEASLAESTQALRNQISVLEDGAGLVARDCLETLFGDTGPWDAAVRQILKVQLARLETALVVEVHLSQSDFRDAGAVAEIAFRNGLAPHAVKTQPDLPPGSCTIRLRLGELDAGVAQQWSVLRDTLEQMALAEAAP